MNRFKNKNEKNYFNNCITEKNTKRVLVNLVFEYRSTFNKHTISLTVTGERTTGSLLTMSTSATS